MKNLLKVVVVVLCVFLLTGCGSKKETIKLIRETKAYVEKEAIRENKYIKDNRIWLSSVLYPNIKLQKKIAKIKGFEYLATLSGKHNNLRIGVDDKDNFYYVYIGTDKVYTYGKVEMDSRKVTWEDHY